MADEEAPLIKQAAAPAKLSSAWRLAVVVAAVLGLVAGYVVRGAVMNETTPLELRSGGHPAHGSGGEEVISFVEDTSFGADTDFMANADEKYSAPGVKNQ